VRRSNPAALGLLHLTRGTPSSSLLPSYIPSLFSQVFLELRPLVLSGYSLVTSVLFAIYLFTTVLSLPSTSVPCLFDFLLNSIAFLSPLFLPQPPPHSSDISAVFFLFTLCCHSLSLRSFPLSLLKYFPANFFVFRPPTSRSSIHFS
jgi:hypothetical protein